VHETFTVVRVQDIVGVRWLEKVFEFMTPTIPASKHHYNAATIQLFLFQCLANRQLALTYHQ